MSDKILSLHNNVDTGLKVETERHEYKDKTKPPKVKYKDIQAIPIKEFINTIAQYSINTHYKYADKDVTLGQTISNIFQRFNMSKDYSIQENFGGKIKEIPKIQEKILKETFEKSIRQRAKEVIKEFFIDVDLEYANNRYIGLYDILSKSFKDIEE